MIGRIVIDASAMVEALVGEDPDAELLDALSGEIHAPHLLDTEVLSVLRRLTLASKLTLTKAEAARANHFAFRIERHGAEPLADRIWSLRNQLTTYDASYLTLAEALGAPLYTCDAKLGSPGHHAEIRVVPRST